MYEDCKSLNDIAKKEFGKINYSNREKAKKLLLNLGLDWKTWKSSKKTINKKYCKYCGKEILKANNQFCNHSCFAKYINKKRKEVRYCKNCGKEITTKTFCSKSCQQQYYYNEYIRKWLAGEETGIKGKNSISLRIRKYLLFNANYKCELCGWGRKNPFSNTIPLEIHHKDGDYSNNSIDNLQVLCPNCHSLTDTYKNRNKLGRSKRLKNKISR